VLNELGHCHAQADEGPPDEILRSHGPYELSQSGGALGYRVVEGKVLTHPAELRVCRLIVDLVARQSMNYLTVSQYLTAKGVRNRRGTSVWHNYTVCRIYVRWKGKP
jgi:hypothetical protein